MATTSSTGIHSPAALYEEAKRREKRQADDKRPPTMMEVMTDPVGSLARIENNLFPQAPAASRGLGRLSGN